MAEKTSNLDENHVGPENSQGSISSEIKPNLSNGTQLEGSPNDQTINSLPGSEIPNDMNQEENNNIASKDYSPVALEPESSDENLFPNTNETVEGNIQSQNMSVDTGKETQVPWEEIEDLVANQGIEEEGTQETPILLNERYQIFSARPLPELDSPSAKAYIAEDLKGAYPHLFAIITLPGFATRVDVIEEIKGQKIPGLLTLMEFGFIDWPIFGKMTSALLYERPLGGRVSNVISEETSDYNKIEFIQSSISGIIEGLAQLQTRGITHRAIRPDNLYFLDEGREKVVLGDFLSTPPGFDQPVIFETIESSMTNEGSRGEGDSTNDMYSFGATIACMSQSELPFKENTKEEIIVSKLNNSSFQTIVGKYLITTKVLELIRGLLLDETSERWNDIELRNWTNGLPIVPSPSIPAHKAHRPFKLQDVDHFSPRTLAYSMSLRPEEAFEAIEDGTLTNWVLKDLMDDDLTPTFLEKLDEAKKNSEKSRDRESVLLANVLILLDPQAPIRYKESSFMPDAFGAALITESVRAGDFRSLIGAVINQLPDYWEEINEERKFPNTIERVNFGRLKSHLQKTGFGYGIERCIYELCWDFPCQSSFFEHEYVIHIEKLLPALDRVEKDVDHEKQIIDRHIASFIAARVRKSVAPFLQDISEPDDAVKTLASLKLLTYLQGQYGPDSLKDLSKWIGSQVEPIIRLYQSHSTQKHLETEVPKVIRNGKLRDLSDLLDDPESRLKDSKNYEEAIEAFRKAQEEVEKIEKDMGPDSDTAATTSKQVAAVISISVMTFVIFVMFLI